MSFTTNLYGENLSIHDLTRRSTCFSCVCERRIKIFQFTTSQGGRRSPVLTPVTNINLSIHDLTRRSTLFCCTYHKNLSLSIHDLTRRSTFFFRYCPVAYNVFQFTTSQGGRLNILSFNFLWNIFQFTTSQGGRPVWQL